MLFDSQVIRRHWRMLAGACFALAMLAPRSAFSGEAPGDLQIANLPNCRLSNGLTINNCHLGYRVVGTPNADGSNVVLFPTWYDGQSKYLLDMVHSGLPDISKFAVILIDSLGDGVSSSPSSASPEQHGTSFPHFTIGDMVDAEYALANSVLHLSYVHAVIGISMGGIQAYEWARRYPNYVDRVVPIVGTPWLTSADRMDMSIMQQSITLDPGYQAGQYKSEPKLAFANEIEALLQYTPQHRVQTTPANEFASYLAKVHAMPSIGANNRLWQLSAISSLANGPEQNVPADRRLPEMLIVTSLQDHQVNPQPSLDWAKATNSKLLVLKGDCGHLAFVCELDTIVPAVHDFLAEQSNKAMVGHGLGH